MSITFTSFRVANFAASARQQSFVPWWKTTKLLRPDLALDFQGLLRSALIAKISGAKEIYGMSDAREGSRAAFIIASAKVNRRAHAVERYLKAGRNAPARQVGESLRCPIPDRRSAAAISMSIRRLFLLHPFARGGGKSLSNAVIEEILPRLCAHPRRRCRAIAAQDRRPGKLRRTDQPDVAAPIDLAHSRRALCHQRRQRPDAHRRGRD